MSLPLPLQHCPPAPSTSLPPRAADLREEEVSTLIARQHVIHQHRGPRAILAQPHLVGTLGAQSPRVITLSTSSGRSASTARALRNLPVGRDVGRSQQGTGKQQAAA